MKEVIGVVLAGGYGTRLLPLTLTTNKHLLPVYNKHMILYPIDTLVKAGITEIMIITGRDQRGASMADQFIDLLGGDDKDKLELLLGRKLQNKVNFHYKLQEKAGGIPQAIALAKRFVGDSNFVTILGDNIVEHNIQPNILEFANAADEAHIFLKQLPENKLFGIIKGERRAKYGIAELNDGKIVGIEEKPINPKSNFAVTGIYIYTPTAFDVIASLKPSWRGELEVSELNDYYVKRGKMRHSVIDGFWLDFGEDHDALLDGAVEVRKIFGGRAASN